MKHFWAIRIQSAYRALAGRRAADLEAKRQAFYAAKELARADAETKVRAEYDALENLAAGSTKRLKWDAKVRMQQVKLPYKRFVLEQRRMCSIYGGQECGQGVAQGGERVPDNGEGNWIFDD